MSITGHLYKIYTFAASRLRKNKLLTFLLFKVKVQHNNIECWDWTSVIIRNSLHKFITPGCSMLDMGTGPFVVLSNYAASEYPGIKITAADFIDEVIQSAGQYLRNGEIKLIKSNLFENIPDKFDVIVFNSPYISEKGITGLGMLKDKILMKRLFGGEKGLDTVERFLEPAKEHLTKNGHILLGLNKFHADTLELKKLILKKNLNIQSIINNHLTGAVLYVLN